MFDSIFISDMVPVYREENYLSRYIENILNQAIPDFEHILIDDDYHDKGG